VQVFLQAIDFRVTNICSIEKGYEVEEGEPWDKFEVEFPKKFAILKGKVSVEHLRTEREHSRERRALLR
jgi:hypothetical protein